MPAIPFNFENVAGKNFHARRARGPRFALDARPEIRHANPMTNHTGFIGGIAARIICR
jgi:hypothetical protein